MVLRHLADSNLKDDQLARVDRGTVEHCVKGWVIDAWVAVVVQSPCFVVPSEKLHFPPGNSSIFQMPNITFKWDKYFKPAKFAKVVAGTVHEVESGQIENEDEAGQQDEAQ